MFELQNTEWVGRENTNFTTDACVVGPMHTRGA